MKCLYEEETDMRYTLENENLKVEIDSFGAEIKSVEHPLYYFRLSVRRKTKNTVMTEKLIRWDSTDLQEIWSLH